MRSPFTSHVVVLATSALLALTLGACDKKNSNDGDPDTTTDGDTDMIEDTVVEDTASEDTVPEDAVEDTVEEEVVDPCTIYPCGTTGTALGNIVPDLSFEPGNTAATELAGADGMLDLHDLYANSVTNGGDLQGLFIFLTAGWCPWCSVEAPTYQAMYEALADDGIMFLAVVSETNTLGAPADGAFAASYASSYGYTFPTVAGDLASGFWEPDVAPAEQGIPLHVFVDMENMRLYGRYSGSMGGTTKIVRYACEEMAAGPKWESEGVRLIDFDCASGTGTETEPNTIMDGAEDGSTLPYTLNGVFCPPTVGDGVLMDEDDIDLGTLTAGTVINVSMEATGSSSVYPAFELLRLNATGTAIDWSTIGPVRVDGGQAQRQWVIDTAGHYVVAGLDGRLLSSFHYGDTTAPDADACCEGGPDFTYQASITTHTLEANESAVSVGSTTGSFATPGDLRVFPLAATDGTNYTVSMVSDSWDNLDPYLVVVNSDGTIIGANDDRNYAGGDYDSEVSWTQTGDGEVLIAASYWVITFNGTPGFTLSVTN